ncbi:glutamate-5-semialdehyde dehydrogenase [Lentisphaerota bacterium ZTH]|nr:glutamate-5-semialdehyde dehydrogenase [Lentisphaerota bacterium]WET05431.1 glutamate-5-semialdehyde dehydrogenase [Lentisphaerota bacterium ZTH]
MTEKFSFEEIQNTLQQMGEKALAASRALAVLNSNDKNRCLIKMAEELEASADEIITANAVDLEAGRSKGLSGAMLDRLKLDPERIQAMADGLREVAALEDPVDRTLSTTVRPNGIRIDKISVPIGVIGIVYESRPNVTVDAAGLCLKAGNAVILRGGSEAINSNLVLAHCLNRAGVMTGLPDGAVQLIPMTDRQAVSAMLKMDKYIDLIIPRGGEGLIRAVVEQSTIPVIKHYKGVCHLYVDTAADIKMAAEIVENAKCQRPGVCNAIETLLINRDIADEFIPPFLVNMRENGVELRGDEAFRNYAPQARIATEEDYYAEYVDLILAVKIVDNVDAAVNHINKYGSRHSDGIITEDPVAAEFFLKRVDSSTVYHNASTRFTDGFEFGMGAEIGISTDKLHARGPMGLNELTSYKYLVHGNGQIRK